MIQPLRSVARLIVVVLAVVSAPACITYGAFAEDMCDMDLPAPTARSGVYELQPEGTVLLDDSVEVDPSSPEGCETLCEALASPHVNVGSCDAIALDAGDPLADEAGITDVEAVQVNCSVEPVLLCL